MSGFDYLSGREYFPDILVESCDSRSVKIWTPHGSSNSLQEWERFLTITEKQIPVGPFRSIKAAREIIREKKHAGWWRQLFLRGAGQTDENDRSIPGGKEGESLTVRLRDVVFALGENGTDYSIEDVQKHFPVADRCEQVGPSTWIVIGVAVSDDGTVFPEPLVDAGTPVRQQPVLQPPTPTPPTPPPHVASLGPPPINHGPTISNPPSQSGVSPPLPLPSLQSKFLEVSSTSNGNTPHQIQTSTNEPLPYVVRVFVSSTFRDMKAERNYLMGNIFPQLRKLCEMRELTWCAVDYRWGITEDEKEQKQVLPIVLRELSGCDFFIGLIGERYGWVPEPHDWPSHLLEQASWLKDYQQRSLTEIEIAHAVLRDPRSSKRAFFYFRDPAFLSRLPSGSRAEDFQSETEEAKRELERLKSEITRASESGACQLREQPFRTVEELGGWVVADFEKLIDELRPQNVVVSEARQEHDVHLAQAESRSRVYVKRGSAFDRLDRHVNSHDAPRVVTGESGVGKSSLLANYFLQFRREHPDHFALIHFIGCTPDGADEIVLMRRIMLALKEQLQIPQDVPFMPDQVRDSFRQWLERGAQSKRLLIILDALNQIHDVGRALDLDWLPKNIPANCRLIVSTLHGRPFDAAQRRRWPRYDLNSLEIPERDELLRAYLREDARHLGADQVQDVINARQSANPLFLLTMLEELRRFADHEELKKRIPEYLKAEGPKQLFGVLLRQWNRHFGSGVVAKALSLVWASRHGLAESELWELLGAQEDRTIPLRWSQFFRATEPHFVVRRGLIGFAHDDLRSAVAIEFASGCDQHRQLAIYFECSRKGGLSDRLLDELLWQIFRSEQSEKLMEWLVDRETFQRLRSTERGKSELQQYWLFLASTFDPREAYAEAARRWEATIRVASELTSAISDLGVFHLERAEFIAAEPLIRRALAIDEQSYGAEDPAVARDLNNLATLSSHEPSGGGRAAAAPLLGDDAEVLRENGRRTSQCRRSHRTISVSARSNGVVRCPD